MYAVTPPHFVCQFIGDTNIIQFIAKLSPSCTGKQIQHALALLGKFVYGFNSLKGQRYAQRGDMPAVRNDLKSICLHYFRILPNRSMIVGIR